MLGERTHRFVYAARGTGEPKDLVMADDEGPVGLCGVKFSEPSSE